MTTITPRVGSAPADATTIRVIGAISAALSQRISGVITAHTTPRITLTAIVDNADHLLTEDGEILLTEDGEHLVLEGGEPSGDAGIADNSVPRISASPTASVTKRVTL